VSHQRQRSLAKVSQGLDLTRKPYNSFRVAYLASYTYPYHNAFTTQQLMIEVGVEALGSLDGGQPRATREANT
jgi:hypothetical protein